MPLKRFVLNTGSEIPALGFGTWQSKPGEVARSVQYALEIGYRHIDAAYCYGNEEEVGAGLKAAFESGVVKREDVFVTTKLWCTYHTKVSEGLKLSLEALGLDYVNLFLVHWPVAMNPNGNDDKFPKLPNGDRDLLLGRSHVDTWRDVEKVFFSGKTKAIGVANYSVPYLKELLSSARVRPAVNQIENHPLLPQQEIVDYCNRMGIHVTAYSPLGSSGSPLIQLPVAVDIARRRGISPASVLLSWHGKFRTCIQLFVGYPELTTISCAVCSRRSVLTKSTTPSRIEENSHLAELEPEDMEAIDTEIQMMSKQRGFKRYVYPAFGVDFGFPDKS